MTLEEYIAIGCDLAEQGRVSNWQLGDLLAQCVKDCGKKATLEEFGQNLKCSKNWLGDLIRVAVTFEAEYRYPDQPWQLYKECYKAAKRLNKHPYKVLEDAVSKELHCADIARLGAPERAVWQKWTCGNCATETKTKTGQGQAVVCPRCAAEVLREHEDYHKILLGVA